MRIALLGGTFVAAAIGSAAMAQSFVNPPPRGPAAPAAQPAPDPAMEAAQKAYDALPENDRRAIQESLMWTGDYNAVVGVNFGKRLYDGIRAYQKKKNFPQTGVLTDQVWTALLAEGKRARDSVRFTTLDDAVTKIRIGAPLRVTEKRSPVTGAGFVATSYSSNDLALSLELATWPLTSKTLEQSYAEESVNKPGRKVTYKFQRPDFFVTSGEDTGRIYYTRAAKNAREMRMFTFSYPAARKADFERVMLAVANSFDPFPGTTTVAETPSSGPASPGPVAPPARPVFAATGLVIAPGRALTSAAVLQACAAPIVNGAPARVDGAPSGGAIILAIQGGRPAPVAASRAAPADSDAAVALSAAPGQPAQVASGALRAFGESSLLVAGLAGGAMGAPVFDRNGALVGLVAEAPKAFAVAALGAAPAVNHKIAPAAGFAALLPASGAPAGDNLSAGAIAARIAPAVVAIGCGT